MSNAKKRGERWHAFMAAALMLSMHAMAENTPLEIKTTPIKLATLPEVIGKIRQLSEIERLEVERGIRTGDQFVALYFQGVVTNFQKADENAWSKIAPLVALSDDEWEGLSYNLMPKPFNIGDATIEKGEFIVCPQLALSSFEHSANGLMLTYSAKTIGVYANTSKITPPDSDTGFYPIPSQKYEVRFYLNEHGRVTRYEAPDDWIAEVPMGNLVRWLKNFVLRAQSGKRQIGGYGITDADIRAAISFAEKNIQQIEFQEKQNCK